MLNSSGDAELVVRSVELLHHRIIRLVGMQRILDRAFNRLVMFGERAIGHHADGAKNRPTPSGFMMNGPR